jgi:UDP-glucose 4-epimerase
VARHLLDQGDNVTVLTRSAPSGARRRRLAGATVHVADVRDSGALPHLLADMSHVVYALGSFSPAESAIRPSQELVEVLPRLVDLLEMLRLHEGIGLTFLSSGGAVYGQMEHGPHTEQSRTKPISAYGITKLACEQFVAMYHDRYGVPASIYRVSNVYGPGQAGDRMQGLVGEILRAGAARRTLPLYGGTESIRDYVHVDDVAGVVSRLSREGVPFRVLNVGTGAGTSSGEVLDVVEAVTGLRPDVQIQPRRPFDVAENVLDVSALSCVTTWRPRSLRAGVADTWRDGDCDGAR